MSKPEANEMEYVLDSFKLKYEVVGEEPTTTKEIRADEARRRNEMVKSFLMIDLTNVIRRWWQDESNIAHNLASKIKRTTGGYILRAKQNSLSLLSPYLRTAQRGIRHLFRAFKAWVV